MSFFKRVVRSAIIAPFLVASAHAVTLDWEAVARTAGSFSNFTFTFTYGSGTVADPTYQHVGFYDITFTPVAEINPAWSAVGSCLIAAVLILRHSAKFRK